MSAPEQNDEFNQENQENREEYITTNDVEEEVADDNGPPPPDDDENDMDLDLEENENGDLEIDLLNNSWTFFDRHTDSIFTVFKHPTLPMVVTGGGDNTAYMWTTHTQPPRFVGELRGHKESVVCGGFTGDGKFVVTGDMNGLIQVHKASKGGQKWTKFGDLEEVEEVLWISVHPSLPYFAFGSTDGSVWVYQIDEDSKELVQIMLGFLHTLECNNGIFINTDKQDELFLVTISEDGSIICWNAFTGAVQYKLQPHDDFKGVESPWVSVRLHKNVLAVGARDGQLAIVNSDSGKILSHIKTIEDVEDVADLSIEALAWCKNPAMPLLAVGLVSGDILFFDALTWRLRKSFKVEDTITRLEFVDDSAVLIGSSMNGKIYKWDARTGQELFTGVGHNMGVLDFAVLDQGNTLVTAGDEGVSLVFHVQ